MTASRQERALTPVRKVDIVIVVAACSKIAWCTDTNCVAGTI